ncbi:MAG: LarC family nickel insertion protein, partial [Phycisphaerae bacterium]|nr:LarC family nickel insertion protein [Phycisphaerae bacterium]
MKIAYFDCFCGAAGDMVVGACLDAGASQEVLRQELEKLDLEGVQVKIEKVIKNGIAASSFKPLAAETDHHHVESGHHHGRTLEAIIGIIERAKLSKRVTDQSIAIFQRLAEAEATVHGLAIEEIHFHEVGMADAIMDIVGAVVALESLGVDKVYCSELVTGRGTVPCAHGILPVPAPATAELIGGVVSGAGDLECELLTPTGAPILTTLAEEFGGMPGMKMDQIGYGAGTRELPDRANVLRV